MTEGKIGIYAIVGAVGVGVFLMVVLLPMSFHNLEYYEIGFRKRKSTGAVDLSEVFTGGKHLLGPDMEFKTFKGDSHMVSLSRISVFTFDKLQVDISATFQYFLRKDQLKKLHDKFDIYYEDVMRTSAVDALKGATTEFTTRDFFIKRREVEYTLFHAVRNRLGGKCCPKNCAASVTGCPANCKPTNTCSAADEGLFADVRYFQLRNLDIPNDVEERYLTTLTIQEDAEREHFIQEAQVVRKETEADVNNIQNIASEIRSNATSQSELLGSLSLSNYTANIEIARSNGLKHLYTNLGITNQEHMNTFDYLRSLQGLGNVHLTVDFQQRIVGGLK